MTAPDIDGLVERLEKCSGPDRELDNLINWHICGAPFWVADWPKEHAEFNGDEPPRFTESIDAALTLVPTEHEWLIRTGERTNGTAPFAHVWPCGEPRGSQAEAPTLAIALCIAAIRARAQAEEDER